MASRILNIDDDEFVNIGPALNLVPHTEYLLEVVAGPNILLLDVEAEDSSQLDVVPPAPNKNSFGHVMWPGSSARPADLRGYRSLRGWYLFAKSTHRVATLVVTEA